MKKENQHAKHVDIIPMWWTTCITIVLMPPWYFVCMGKKQDKLKNQKMMRHDLQSLYKTVYTYFIWHMWNYKLAGVTF